jgi:Na+-translocating ferredoxin:NAD+ oxidoreductase RnfG subunit
MHKFFILVLIAGALTSCKRKIPAQDDIQKKLLTEFVCPETARIRHFEIVQHDEIKNATGNITHRYLVQGQMEWPSGCNDDGTVIPAGRQQSFEQTVFLTETKNGQWQ